MEKKACDATTFFCRACSQHLPLESFHASAIRKRKHGCKLCTIAANADFCRRRPEVVIAGNINGHNRRRGIEARVMTPDDVKAVFEGYDYTCAVTGERLPAEQLSLARPDANQPFARDNATPIARRLARSLKGAVPPWARSAASARVEAAAGVGGGEDRE
jgi:hypothetical protein